MNRRGTAFLFAFLVISAYLIFSRDSKVGSTYTFSPDGARALFVFLEEQGYAPELWLYPYDKLQERASDSGRKYTMILISPESMGAEQKLLDWVKKGNDLIVLSADSSMVQQLLLALDLQYSEELEFFESWKMSSSDSMPVQCNERLSPACAHVRELSSFERHLEAIDDLDDNTRAIVQREAELPQDAGNGSVKNEDSSRSALVFQKIHGKGHVWVLASDKPVRNRSIDKFDNFRLLYQILMRTRGTILFDEFHHGYTAPVSEDLKQEKQSLYLFAGCLVFLLAIFALNRAVRFGDPNLVADTSASGTSEFAAVLGLLYREHEAKSVLGHYLAAWKERVEREHGISSRLSAEHYHRELERQGFLSEDEGYAFQEAYKVLSSSLSLDSTRAETAVYALEKLYLRMKQEDQHAR